MGTKCKIITGYSGAPESCLAMERGEVQGCLNDIGNMKATKRAWIDGKKIGALFQMGKTVDPICPSIPHYASLCKTEDDRNVLAVFSISADVGRAIMAPPGIPPARVAALPAAFTAMTKDPDFIAEAAGMNLELNTATGAEIQKVIKGAANISPIAIARAKAAREVK